MLYFVRKVQSDAEEHRTVYELDTRLPVEFESDVLAALKRRSVYPVVEVERDGKTSRCREVMFRGTTDAAIELFGSESEPP